VPTFDFAVRLRIIGRSPDVRHARNANELLEVLGDELRPVVGNDSRFNAGILLFGRFQNDGVCSLSELSMKWRIMKPRNLEGK
jgi:hypothetical protein